MNDQITAEVKLVESQNARKATATITINTIHGELTIKKLSVIHQEGKTPWVAYPTIDFKDKESGEFQHIEILLPGLPLKKAISESVLSKYKELSENDLPF